MERVEISMERFMDLVEKEAKLNMLKKYVANASTEYGLSSSETKTVELMLDINRSEE
jgi:hypothetical protein